MKIENGNNFDLSNSESFEPIKTNNSFLKFAIALVLFAILGFATYWFYFKKDDLSRLEESLGLENDNDSSIVEFDSANATVDETFNSKPKQEGIIQVNDKQNVHYVVIGSFMDKDLALDYAKGLLKTNPTVYVISKPSGKYTYIALESFDQENDAKDRAKSLASTYPHGTWVLFY